MTPHHGISRRERYPAETSSAQLLLEWFQTHPDGTGGYNWVGNCFEALKNAQDFKIFPAPHGDESRIVQFRGFFTH